MPAKTSSGTPRGKIAFGAFLGLLIAILYINVNFFFAGQVEEMKNLLTAYIILLVIALTVFNVDFPSMFQTPVKVLKFCLGFFAFSILLLLIPTLPASLVGSITVTAKNSFALVQSFLAGFIETIAIIYAIYKVVTNPMVRFWLSNIVFVVFHIAVIWGRISQPQFAIYPWYVVIGVSSAVLFTLNSAFQFVYNKFGGDKGDGLEMTVAAHMVWDMKNYGILQLLFKGIIFAI